MIVILWMPENDKCVGGRKVDGRRPSLVLLVKYSSGSLVNPVLSKETTYCIVYIHCSTSSVRSSLLL